MNSYSLTVLTCLIVFECTEPSTSIYGGPDIHVHEGSPVNLSCLVSQSVGQPEFFFWYHNGQARILEYSIRLLSGSSLKLLTWTS